MDEKTRNANRERQRRLREKRKKELSMLHGEELGRCLVKLEVSITKSVRDLLSTFAADTGTYQEILVERALIEYISRHKDFLSGTSTDDFHVYYRPVKYAERCHASITGDIIELVPKVKSFWDA